MAEVQNNLDKRQKLALAGLAVFAVCLLIIWVLKIESEIKGPLNLKYSAAAASSTAQSADDKLKSQDTDGDGLSDWDEINVYHTSPYLADSDSDGIPDGTEVRNGTDPNCPQGQNCNAAITGATSTPAIPALGSTSVSGQGSASSSLIDYAKIDPATIRNVLLQAGMDKNSLDKLSDVQLMKAYQDTLASSTNQ